MIDFDDFGSNRWPINFSMKDFMMDRCWRELVSHMGIMDAHNIKRLYFDQLELALGTHHFMHFMGRMKMEIEDR